MPFDLVALKLVASVLLFQCQVVRVVNFRVSSIGNGVSALDCLGGKEHVFVAFEVCLKAAEFLIFFSSVCSTHIRKEKSLDTLCRNVCFGMQLALFRIVENPNQLFPGLCILFRELSCINCDGIRFFKGSNEAFDERLQFRNGILSHKDNNIAHRHGKSQVSSPAVVELIFGNDMCFDERMLLCRFQGIII